MDYKNDISLLALNQVKLSSNPQVELLKAESRSRNQGAERVCITVKLLHQSPDSGRPRSSELSLEFLEGQEQRRLGDRLLWGPMLDWGLQTRSIGPILLIKFY